MSYLGLQIDLLNELEGAPYVIHLFDVYQTETYVFLVFELMKVIFAYILPYNLQAINHMARTRIQRKKNFML